MDFIDDIMIAIIRGVTRVFIHIGMFAGERINALIWALFRWRNRSRIREDTALAKAEQDENQRIAECRQVVLEYARLQGHIARDCMTRDELEEKIDQGITADALRAELDRRINLMPGILLGVNQHFQDLRIKLPLSQMERHTYIIGKSGAGKTNLIRSMLLQNIYLGHGVGVIAPEAELLVDDIIPYIPNERINDVVYINAADVEFPVPINPLYIEAGEDVNQKVEDMATIFKRIVGDTGARMDHILNNTLHALVERKNTTLLDIPRLLTDQRFQQDIIATTRDSQTKDFFTNEYPAYQKGAYLPITSRLGMFTRRELIRNLLCQPGQSFNFRRAMDEGKIVLINLSDGLLGPQTAQILGQIIVSKIQLAAMSRADTPAAARRPFYLYLDEFQAFTGVNEDSYESMLSRARKYRLNLILAHQYTHQLSGDLLHAILGNVATIISFSVSRSDAERLVREFLMDTGTQMFELPSEELLRLKVGDAWGKTGTSIFPLKTMLVDQNPDKKRAEYIIEQSRRNYGRKPPDDPPPDDRSLPPHDDTPPPDDKPPDAGKVF